jgi:hypothetical protein
MGLKRRMAAALASAALGTMPAVAADLDDFVGHYAYAGTAAEQKALSAEVDRTIDQLNPLLRPLARLAVDRSKMTPQTIIIRLEGKSIGMQAPPHPERVSPTDGSPVSFTQQGHLATIRRRLEGRVLIEESDSKGGHSRTAISLSANGQRLTMRSVVSTPHAPLPLKITLTYRRQGQ